MITFIRVLKDGNLCLIREKKVTTLACGIDLPLNSCFNADDQLNNPVSRKHNITSPMITNQFKTEKVLSRRERKLEKRNHGTKKKLF